jgi:hypothetical protein
MIAYKVLSNSSLAAIMVCSEYVERLLDTTDMTSFLRRLNNINICSTGIKAPYHAEQVKVTFDHLGQTWFAIINTGKGSIMLLDRDELRALTTPVSVFKRGFNTSYDGRTLSFHRLISLDPYKQAFRVIHHINGVAYDNRSTNLVFTNYITHRALHDSNVIKPDMSALEPDSYIWFESDFTGQGRWFVFPSHVVADAMASGKPWKTLTLAKTFGQFYELATKSVAA